MRIYYVGESRSRNLCVATALGVDAEYRSSFAERVQDWRRVLEDDYRVPTGRTLRGDPLGRNRQSLHSGPPPRLSRPLTGSRNQHTRPEIPGALLPERWRQRWSCEPPGPHCLSPDQLVNALFPALQEAVDVVDSPHTLGPSIDPGELCRVFPFGVQSPQH